MKRINGRFYSWASISIRINSTLITAIKSISYSDSRTPVKGYGAGRAHAPLGRTSGKYETAPVTCSIEKVECQELRKALADAAGGKSFGETEFQIVVQYDDNGKHITDTLDRCVWTKNSTSADDGGDPLYEEVEFDCMSISWNGVNLFADEEQ
jgi:hypothetical protein